MNADPVFIVDDDVDMEPVVILDEDDENINKDSTPKVARSAAVETIDLDDEAPIVIRDEAVCNNAETVNKKSELSFVNNLKNNRLMDKIVSKVTTMENAIGMNRVVHRTLLPLYRDATNRFKETEDFRQLLKRTYKLLVKDPDHKFLHVKSLCEELKSGGLRRKVPFVTLATNLRNNASQRAPAALTSSSREINHNNEGNKQIYNVKRKYQNTRKRVSGRKAKRKPVQAKDRIKTRSITNTEMNRMEDIIDVDDSETESVVINSQKCDGDQNEVIIIEETEPSDPKNCNNQNKVTLEEDSRLQETEVDSRLKKTVEDSRLQETEEDSRLQQTVEVSRLQETLEGDSNKENNHKNRQSSENTMDYDLLIPTNVCKILPASAGGFSRSREFPIASNQNVKNSELIAALEKRIEFNKKMIDELEEKEVLTSNPLKSPYYICSKYKEDIVACYKRICEILGESKELVKRREIRLLVAEGHPSGPAKRLEQFLNSTIDVTGAVEFPDFSDVVKCVVESNQYDNLNWNRQEVMQEAVALFRQCGQALRKRRQKREYRDLLSLIPGKKEIEDPAEKDPVLLAKLEENKQIAKIKEEQILDRYVRMENNAFLAKRGISHVAGSAAFESDNDSSDSENEPNTTIRNNVTISTSNNQPAIGECSGSNTGLNLLPNNAVVPFAPNVSISSLQTNNTTVSSVPRNNHCYMTPTSNPNNVYVYNIVGAPTVSSASQNPMLMSFLIMPPAPLYFVHNTNTNQNHCATRESSTNDAIINNRVDVLATNDAIINNRIDVLATNGAIISNRVDMLATNDAIINNPVDVLNTNADSTTNDTMLNECEERESSDEDEEIKSELTISETVVGFNIDTTNGNSEKSSMNNIENTEPLVKIEPCDDTAVQDTISSTTDGVERNYHSSIISAEIKTETVVKSEPLDIQSMFDELGDDFVCQVFDVEDPFLVIEISSDGYSDDDVL